MSAIEEAAAAYRAALGEIDTWAAMERPRPMGPEPVPQFPWVVLGTAVAVLALMALLLYGLLS